MELTKSTTEIIGKVFVDIGKGFILATFVSNFFGERTDFIRVSIGLAIGIFTVGIGLYFNYKAESMEV